MLSFFRFFFPLSTSIVNKKWTGALSLTKELLALPFSSFFFPKSGDKSEHQTFLSSDSVGV